MPGLSSVARLGFIAFVSLFASAWSWPWTSTADSAADTYIKQYLKTVGLLPIVMPLQQRPGDVFTSDNVAVMYSRADQCFSNAKPILVPGNNVLPAKEVESTTGVEVAAGLPSLAEAKIFWTDIASVRIVYSDVETYSSNTADLRAGFKGANPTCAPLTDAVFERVGAVPKGGRLYIVVGTVVRARKNVDIVMKSNKSINLSAMDLRALLQKIVSRSGLRLDAFDVQVRVDGGRSVVEKISYRTESPVEVAFAPAFIPSLIREGFAGPSKPVEQQRIEGLQWSAADGKDVLDKPDLRSSLRETVGAYKFGVGRH